MLQQEEADDYVIAAGEVHSVREFLEEAFSSARLQGSEHVEIDPKYYRPAEVDLLVGDASKAKRKLGWEPKTRFKELVRLMLDAELGGRGAGDYRERSAWEPAERSKLEVHRSVA